MLNAEIEFPYAGSKAFLLPDAEPVRIIRANLDGTAMIARLPQSGMTGAEARLLRTVASGNTTVALAELAATAEEAIGQTPKRRRRKAR